MRDYSKIEDEETVDVFEYLDELRESGVVNMFGATEYLMMDLDMDKRMAIKFLSEWMDSYEKYEA